MNIPKCIDELDYDYFYIEFDENPFDYPTGGGTFTHTFYKNDEAIKEVVLDGFGNVLDEIDM